LELTLEDGNHRLTINLLAEDPQPVKEISLNPTTNPEYAEADMEEAVEKTTYAAAGTMPMEEVRANYWLGYEKNMRERMLVDAAISERKVKQGLIQQTMRLAASEGRAPSPEERDFILNIDLEEFAANPNTIIERLYATRFTQDVVQQAGEEVLLAEEESPEGTRIVRDAVEEYTTKQQIAQKVLAEVKARADKASILDKGFAFAKGLIPFYSWFQQTNKIDNNGALLLGENVEKQMRSLYLMSPEEFEVALRKAVSGIESENILEAFNFASSAVRFSGSDALWGNIFTALDAYDVATLGAAGAIVKFAKRAQGTVKAGAVSGATTKQARQVLTGDIAGASETQAIERLQAATTSTNPAGAQTAGVAQSVPVQQLETLMRGVPGLLDPKSFTRNIGSLSNERAARLEEVLTRNAELLISTSTDISHIGRISDQAAAKGFELAELEFKKTYPTLEDSIVDVRNIRESEEVFGGVDRIDVLLGKKDATSFNNEKTARRFATDVYRLAEGSFDIVDEAGNFFIKMTKTIDETATQLSDLRLGTDNLTPVNLANTVLGALRSNTYLVSNTAAAWRHVATYGGNAVMARLAEVAQSIAKLGKNETTRLRTILDDERVRVGSGKAPLRTVAEFEQEYMTKFRTLPTDNELVAWSTYRQIADYDYIVRNVSQFRDKARLGVEQKSVGYSRGTETEGGKTRWNYVQSDMFEARTVPALPSTQEPYTVAFIDPQNGRWHFGVSDRMFPNVRKKLHEAIDSGNYKVLQVADVRNKMIRDLVDSKGEPVEYIVVRDVKTKPLSPVQIPYSADMPFHDVSGFFIKQARTHKTGHGRRVYDGDSVMQRAVSNLEARKLLASYEQGRQMVKAAMASPSPNLNHITTFVQNNLPFGSAREFIQLFRGTPYSGEGAVFDLDTPFTLTNTGEKAGDSVRLDSIFGEEIVDLDKSSHNLATRTADTVGGNTPGTQQNPIVGISAAPTLDPMSVISRAGERIARSRFYDDYVHRSVEDWVAQFGETLDVSPEVLRANPMRFLIDPPYKKGYQDAAVLAAAKNSRRAILSLLNQDTAESKTWKWMRQKVVDGAFAVKGQKGAQIMEPWMFNRNTDPIHIARSLVFHAKLGLFNVVQFPLQGASIVHAAAIDGNPLRAVQAQFAYWGMRARGLSEVNPKAQGLLTKKVSAALGVSEAHLDEMYEAWRRSGVGIVGGEYGPLDDYLNPKMFFGQGPVGKALDVGTFFFKEGNNWHRGTSFATSYLSWRQKNPEAKLNNAALRDIVNRADMMYMNMSRDSNAAWQKGFPSIASTFFAYHARMSEQLLGKRLTGLEKVRLMTTYSAMWGVPIGVGGTLAGALWPVGESVQQALQEQGIDGDANVITKVLTEGIADTLVEWATGEDYNISERFGPGGLSWLRDIADGQMFEVLQGAPGSFIGDLLSVGDPLAMAVVSVFDDKPGTYPLTQDDFVSAMRLTSSVNNAVKAYQVFTLGQWLSKNDQLLKEEDKGNVISAMMAATGLTPDEISEAYLQIRSNKQFDAAKKAVEKEVLVNFERALKFAAQGERQEALSFFKRAHVLMQSAGFTPMERSEVFKRAVTPNREMILDVGEDFVIRDPAKRLERYNQKLEAK
jgi:hypothetical protein